MASFSSAARDQIFSAPTSSPWRSAAMRLNIKKYPACFCGHRAMDGLLDLISAHDLRPDEVSNIMGELMNQIVGDFTGKVRREAGRVVGELEAVVRDVEPAQALARVIATEGETPAEKIRAGFRRVLARVPAESETKPLMALYRETLAAFTAAPERAAAFIKNSEMPPPATIPPAELAAWTAVANVLLNRE